MFPLTWDNKTTTRKLTAPLDDSLSFIYFSCSPLLLAIVFIS